MIKDFNQYMTYPGIELWQDDAWADRRTCLLPLIHWIQAKNKELLPETIGKDTRNDVAFLPPISLAHDHVETSAEDDRFFAERKMRYSWCGLGSYALVPEEYLQPDVEEPTVLLVFAQCREYGARHIPDLFERYREYNEAAAEGRYALIYFDTDGEDDIDWYQSSVAEIAAVNRLSLKNLYLDVSTPINAGKKLKDIEGFALRRRDGSSYEDADSAICRIGPLKIPAIPIAGIWANNTGIIQHSIIGHAGMNEDYCPEKIIHSTAGKRMVEWLKLDYNYSSGDSPELIKHWDEMGLICEYHHYKRETWVSFVPKSVMEKPERKLPVVSVFQEVHEANPHVAVSSFAFYHGFIDLAADGEFILLFFAQESIEDNDILSEIIREAAGLYPIDLSRVYIAGHSHNGGFTFAYGRRHPKEIAAIATLGNYPGLYSDDVDCPIPQFVSDKVIEEMSHEDIPTILVSGMEEMMDFFPLYNVGREKRVGRARCNPVEARANSWRRRLKAYNCPVKTAEEIIATKDSGDYVERMLGIPADLSRVDFVDGHENYVADIKNNAGKYHLRIVGQGDTSHVIISSTSKLVWDFLRRFSRNPETGEIEEK